MNALDFIPGFRMSHLALACSIAEGSFRYFYQCCIRSESITSLSAREDARRLV